MIRAKTIDKFIDLAYSGDTILQIDVPGKFMFTIYKSFKKEVIKYTGIDEKEYNFVRWLWFEFDY